jgi:hypothetical protein
LLIADCFYLQQPSIFNQQPERAMGFEPTTFSLARRRTTTVLRPRVGLFLFAQSAERQNRTDDTAIFSRVLYQLSYLGELLLLLSVRDFTRNPPECQARFFQCLIFILQRFYSAKKPA